MHISKVNEVYLNLKVDSGLGQELADYFTFDVPGAKFMPMYKKRIWDGKIRLYSQKTGKIYCGLLPYIKKFCSKTQLNIYLRRVSKMTGLLFMRMFENLPNHYVRSRKGRNLIYEITKRMPYFILYENIVLLLFLLLHLGSH